MWFLRAAAGVGECKLPEGPAGSLRRAQVGVLCALSLIRKRRWEEEEEEEGHGKGYRSEKG